MDCCKEAEARLIEACGYDAAKAHVKALREHSDGKHAHWTIEEPKIAADKSSKK